MTSRAQVRFGFILPELGNAARMMALLWAHGPVSLTEATQRLGIHPQTARRRADALVDAGHASLSQGILRPLMAKPREALRIPYEWLAEPTLTDEGIRAAAALMACGIGGHVMRKGCRTDRERARLAGVHINTIRRTRETMEALGCEFVARMRRGKRGNFWLVRMLPPGDERWPPEVLTHLLYWAGRKVVLAAMRAARAAVKRMREAMRVPQTGALKRCEVAKSAKERCEVRPDWMRDDQPDPEPIPMVQYFGI